MFNLYENGCNLPEQILLLINSPLPPRTWTPPQDESPTYQSWNKDIFHHCGSFWQTIYVRSRDATDTGTDLDGNRLSGASPVKTVHTSFFANSILFYNCSSLEGFFKTSGIVVHHCCRRLPVPILDVDPEMKSTLIMDRGAGLKTTGTFW
jgi:hypothetical protein